MGAAILRISSKRTRRVAADAMETMAGARTRGRHLLEARQFARDPLKAFVMSFEMASPPRGCPHSIFRPTRSMRSRR